jgi:hypothetical protein
MFKIHSKMFFDIKFMLIHLNMLFENNFILIVQILRSNSIKNALHRQFYVNSFQYNARIQSKCVFIAILC